MSFFTNRMNKNKPTILIIFGISGDLARRYLLPAIGAISKAKMLPDDFHIVGLTRQLGIEKNSLIKNASNLEYLHEHMTLRQMDVEDMKEYQKLKDYLEEVGKNFKEIPQHIFYLSVPPQASKSIIEFLGESGLSGKVETKLLLEKPFGVNLKNSKDLASHIEKYFKDEQVYRVDHYMAKETAQNIIVFREGNSLFKRTWDNNFIEKIEVIASEKIGIEGRANFYEQVGALRDYVQSHLLQLLAIILMKLPDGENFEEVPRLRLKALKNLYIEDVKKDAKRGQYEGYVEEAGNPKSKIETFVSIKLKSKDEKWRDVPMILTTGKALDSKFTEIRILYKKDKEHESNELFLRLQPEEGIQFNMWAKHPGYERKVSPHNLGFKFREHYEILPEAYEQVIFNAINSDHSLFTTSDEILEAWRILDDLQGIWEKSGDGLIIYKKGSTINEVLNISNSK
jgi:glucose-6-phosphate 1-dehydrogenase